MDIYYLKFYPFEDIVRYKNGEIKLDNNYKGETLDTTPFIDKLILEENKSYPDECIQIIKEINNFYKLNSTNIHYLERELYKIELSMQSACL